MTERHPRSRLAQSVAVLTAFWSNRDLRRVGFAFAGFNAAEWAVWIAMLVYAYDHGGATTAGIVAIVQLIPAALVAPFAAGLADRHRPASVLVGGYVAQAAAMGATAAALLAEGPPVLAYFLAAVAASAVTVTRPTQCALLPGLARHPEDLTAANVVLGWLESLSVLAGPALAGVLLGVGGPGWVFATMAAVTGVSALVTRPVAGPPPAGIRDDDGRALAEVLAGVKLLARHPESRLLTGLLGAQYVVIGALDVLAVVLAIGVLDMGQSGAGYLNAAFGAGGVIGIAATAALVGRPRLIPPLLTGIAIWALAFLGIGLAPSVPGAFLLLAAAGVGRSVFDVAGRTLLQRTAPAEVLARVFGVLEGLSMAALALGSLLAPAAVAIGGADAAFVTAAALMPLLVLVASKRLMRIDSSATVPVVELALLRSVPVTAALPGPELERLARGLSPHAVVSGTSVITQGEAGDRFYVVAGGDFDVIVDGRHVNELHRGDAFGEIALLRDQPRNASVTASCDGLVYALGRDDFLAAVAGNTRFRDDAQRLADARLAGTAAVSEA